MKEERGVEMGVMTEAEPLEVKREVVGVEIGVEAQVEMEGI